MKIKTRAKGVTPRGVAWWEIAIPTADGDEVLITIESEGRYTIDELAFMSIKLGKNGPTAGGNIPVTQAAAVLGDAAELKTVMRIIPRKEASS